MNLVIDCKVSLPEGTSGPWSVKKFVVDEEAAKWERIRSLMSSNRGRGVPAGTYTGLYRDGEVIMSDTPDEIRDHRFAIYKAHGHCLVFGLGLGMVTKAMLDNPEVTKVTVVDKSPDVIALVGPTLKVQYGDKLEVIHADAITYKPAKGVRFGCVWADIWDTLTTDNLKLMSTFNRRYARCSDWHGNWGEELLKYRRERGY